MAIAQGEAGIRGVIEAKADRSLIAGAAVRLESSVLTQPLQTTSGMDGSFSFLRLIPGAYTLTASQSGFQDERVQFTLKPREVHSILLQLLLRAPQVAIDVNARVEPLAGVYSPSSTTLERERIEALPVDQRNNLPDMIVMSAPGMIRSHDDFVHVRGHEIALNTFINGVSFFENPHSVFSPGLSPDIIQSVNVMTGGFPAEYGNRFGGVVDIVTKSGLTMDNEGSVSFGAGNALRNNLTAEYGGHTGRLGYYFYSSAFESARFLSPNDPRSIHDTGRGMREFLQLDFNVNPANSLKLVLMGDGTNFQIPKTSLDDQFRPHANASERTRQQSAIFAWNRKISDRTFMTTSFYQRWSRATLLPAFDPLASAASNERTLWTGGVKSEVTHFSGRHILKGGVDLAGFRPDENLFFYGEGYIAFSHLLGLPHVHLRGPNRGPVTFADHRAGGEISGYFQDTIQFKSGLTLNAGLRVDHYNLATSATHFSPRLNMAYQFAGAGTVLHASYDHFFVPPAMENVLISSAGLTRFLQDFAKPLPPLRPIVEDQAEIGVTQPVGRFLRVGTTGYYRLSDNPVHTVLFPDSRIYAYANFDKGKAYGVEFKVDAPIVEPIGLSTFLNYALGRVYFWNPVTAGFVDETHHLEEAGRFLAPMDQTHTLNAGLTYRHRRTGLWTSMSFEYGSGTPTEAEEEEGADLQLAPLRVPGHFTQNLTVGMDLGRRKDRSWVSLQFNIENLTNNMYKVSQESVFSPGEYFNPRFFSASMRIHF